MVRSVTVPLRGGKVQSGHGLQAAEMHQDCAAGLTARGSSCSVIISVCSTPSASTYAIHAWTTSCWSSLAVRKRELAAACRYFTRYLAEDDPGRKDMLVDLATEELSHLEVIGTIVAMLNKGAKNLDRPKGHSTAQLCSYRS
jgi:hypothetical protein